jgi:hypothetical protein
MIFGVVTVYLLDEAGQLTEPDWASFEQIFDMFFTTLTEFPVPVVAGNPYTPFQWPPRPCSWKAQAG